MRIGGQCMSVQWKRMGSGLSLLISLYLFLSSLARSEPLKSPIGTEQVDCLTDGGRIATTLPCRRAAERERERRLPVLCGRLGGCDVANVVSPRETRRETKTGRPLRAMR